jgi:hypothetical protein
MRLLARLDRDLVAGIERILLVEDEFRDRDRPVAVGCRIDQLGLAFAEEGNLQVAVPLLRRGRFIGLQSISRRACPA